MADEKFWEDLCPLEFGDVPALEEDVVCVGFPTGGDNISVTRGVVSRVEIQRYAHSAVELLAIQVIVFFHRNFFLSNQLVKYPGGGGTPI